MPPSLDPTAINVAGLFVLRVEDYRKGRDLAPHRPIERIGEQETAIALTLVTAIDGEPAEKRRRYERIARKFARCSIG